MSKNIIPIEKLKNMHKELKHTVRWFSPKRVILFVLFFSVSLLGGAVYMITEKNKRLKDEYEKQEVYLRQKEALERLGCILKRQSLPAVDIPSRTTKLFLKILMLIPGQFTRQGKRFNILMIQMPNKPVPAFFYNSILLYGRKLLLCSR